MLFLILNDIATIIYFFNINIMNNWSTRNYVQSNKYTRMM